MKQKRAISTCKY
uniref:Uncharacterized protein n=1 Tax=Rhizophora mucronata TaxID=61149 RepID=A0A2P2QVX1_RHIMU